MTIDNSVTHEFDAVSCDSYTWNNETYNESGDYEQLFQTVNDCDSTVTLHLTINNSATHEFDAVSCDTYTWNDTVYAASGDYEQLFETTLGCDSTVMLHLTINNSVTHEFDAVSFVEQFRYRRRQHRIMLERSSLLDRLRNQC